MSTAKPNNHVEFKAAKVTARPKDATAQNTAFSIVDLVNLLPQSIMRRVKVALAETIQSYIDSRTDFQVVYADTPESAIKQGVKTLKLNSKTPLSALLANLTIDGLKRVITQAQFNKEHWLVSFGHRANQQAQAGGLNGATLIDEDGVVLTGRGKSETDDVTRNCKWAAGSLALFLGTYAEDHISPYYAEILTDRYNKKFEAKPAALALPVEFMWKAIQEVLRVYESTRSRKAIWKANNLEVVYMETEYANLKPEFHLSQIKEGVVLTAEGFRKQKEIVEALGQFTDIEIDNNIPDINLGDIDAIKRLKVNPSTIKVEADVTKLQVFNADDVTVTPYGRVFNSSVTMLKGRLKNRLFTKATKVDMKSAYPTLLRKTAFKGFQVKRTFTQVGKDYYFAGCETNLEGKTVNELIDDYCKDKRVIAALCGVEYQLFKDCTNAIFMGASIEDKNKSSVYMRIWEATDSAKEADRVWGAIVNYWGRVSEAIHTHAISYIKRKTRVYSADAPTQRAQFNYEAVFENGQPVAGFTGQKMYFNGVSLITEDSHIFQSPSKLLVWYCQGKELDFIHHTIEGLRAEGLKIASYEYDGFRVEGKVKKGLIRSLTKNREHVYDITYGDKLC